MLPIDITGARTVIGSGLYGLSVRIGACRLGFFLAGHARLWRWRKGVSVRVLYSLGFDVVHLFMFCVEDPFGTSGTETMSPVASHSSVQLDGKGPFPRAFSSEYLGLGTPIILSIATCLCL